MPLMSFFLYSAFVVDIEVVAERVSAIFYMLRKKYVVLSSYGRYYLVINNITLAYKKH